jgi:D-lactate dehydrogenase (cytochrome)
MADGSLIETGTRAAKSSSGYHLTHLFVGSEGTLGIVTRATLRLVGFPEHFSAAVASFSTTHQAAEAVHEIIVSGVHPAALELLAPEVIVLLNNERGLNLPEAPALFMEFHNSSEAGLRQDLEMVAGLCRDQGSLQFRSGLGLSERNRLWEARHQTFETIKRAHPAKSFLIADTAVPISRYPEMVEYARQLLINKEQLGYVFGHAGDGNLHLVLVGQRDDPDSWSRVQDVNQTLVNQALALLWMRKIKDLFDPFHILNPGKMLPDH